VAPFLCFDSNADINGILICFFKISDFRKAWMKQRVK